MRFYIIIGKNRRGPWKGQYTQVGSLKTNSLFKTPDEAAKYLGIIKNAMSVDNPEMELETLRVATVSAL